MDPSEILNIDKKQILSKNLVLSKINEFKQKKFLLPLDSRNFDKILDGGFLLNYKYLIYGANKTGKTQICLNLCVQAYKYFCKLNKNIRNQDFNFIYYLDCENTFRPERIKEIATKKSLEFQEVLKSIRVSKIMGNTALLLKLNEIENEAEPGKKSLLIIDSINNFFRLEQGNKDVSFYNLKSTFLKILNKIDDICNMSNLIVIATAQIFPNFNEDAILAEIPVGNQYLNHYFSEYLYLNYKDERNYVHLVNSKFLPEKRVAFKITSEGIVDYKI